MTASFAAHALLTTDASLTLDAIDTGQEDLAALDTGQLESVDAGSLLAYAAADEALAVTFHEIHRIDEAEGRRELITSTLKYFSLHIAVQDPDGELMYHLDGTVLRASLVYEDGSPVEALSATLEPPLLAAAGECQPKAVVEGGCATFRLRITVLSSLCNKQNFSVRVESAEQPELSVTTAPTKTITKLRRAMRESTGKTTPASRRAPVADENGTFSGGGSCGAKRALSLVASEVGCEVVGCLQELAACEVDAEALSGQSLDQLWDQVSLNGARLLELQAHQRRLFKELRSLKEA